MLVAAIALLSLQGSAVPRDWMPRWTKSILAESKDRYCDRETGEEIGWLISPFLSGFYYGYMATRNHEWCDRMVDWTDSWIARCVKEPDGFVGWPKAGTGGNLEDTLFTDSLLGEAMGFRPVVLWAGEVLKHPSLRAEYGEKATSYLKLAEQIFRKWDARGCWRDVGKGGVWVVPAFGIDKATGIWTSGYSPRLTDGFTNPNNKENLIAEWETAMYDVTKKPIYRERATKWWTEMKSRMLLQQDGKYFVWNYWGSAGRWDYNKDGSTRHWVGVHPNGGYYGIDVDAMVDAYEHGWVFTKSDIDRLVATNRDFMWNQSVSDAKFKRIDGGETDPRWKDSPGVLWVGLTPYDRTLRKVFEANFKPEGWGALSAAPWFVWRFQGFPGS